MTEKELREKLAAIEHDRWSHWQRYLHSKGMLRKDGLVLSHDDIAHWERQINTPYEELSEREKDSDRKEVDKYLPLIKKFYERTD